MNKIDSHSALLQVRNLSIDIQFGQQQKRVVNEVTFSVEKNQTIALIGESGSGKSLIALAITQLLPPAALIDQQSTILLKGEDLLTFSELKMRGVRGRRIGLIFQEAITALNPVMTIGKQILEVLNQHFNFDNKTAYQKVIALLAEVGVPNPHYYFRAYPHQLSGGLKQRTLIAIALAGEPELLIADEPTTALDVTLQAQIIALLQKIQQQRSMGLIFITHDLGVVAKIANQVIVLLQGQVIENANAQAFFHQPLHAYSTKLFAALPTQFAHLPLPEDNSKPLLKVTNLKIYYPIRKGLFKRTVKIIKAVDNISLEIKQGQTLALVGESGSGKTTTGMAILKLIPITSGCLYFSNQDITHHTPPTFRKDIQVIFQDPYSSMDPRMLVGNIIAEGLRAQGILPDPSEKISELLLKVGLDPEAQWRYPHEFSGGQRQRICIARALALTPKLLICDEPTSALDVFSQLQILQLLSKLQTEIKLSYLLITHNLAVVEYLADHVAVMKEGQIVEQGPAARVLSSPTHPYTQKLLKAIPLIPK